MRGRLRACIMPLYRRDNGAIKFAMRISPDRKSIHRLLEVV